MTINYDFPWYIQQSPAFMTLYEGIYNTAEKISSIDFLKMLDLNNVEQYSELLVAAQYYGIQNKMYARQDALIYNLREWSPRGEGETEYYWNGRASEESLLAMANYIRAKTQIRGKYLSLVTIKQFYETLLGGFGFVVGDNIEIIESEQHFEVIVQATEEIAMLLVEMSYIDQWPFGKPVGISYNITYVLPQGE